MADLHRPGTDPLLTLVDPAIPGIAHILQEHRDRALIRADRRMRPPARATHASNCADDHCHGHAPVNSWNRRTVRSRPSISGPLNRRATC